VSQVLTKEKAKLQTTQTFFASESITWGRGKTACFSLAWKPAARRGKGAVRASCFRMLHDIRRQGMMQRVVP